MAKRGEVGSGRRKGGSREKDGGTYQTEFDMRDAECKHGTKEVIYVFAVSRTFIVSDSLHQANQT